MLIDEQFRQCVTFLFVDKQDEETAETKRTPAATAFFVGVPVDGEGAVVYAVTARHVIDASRPYGPLYVRINERSGKYKDFPTSQDDWTCHVSTDIAVIPVGIPGDIFEIRNVPLSILATEEYIAERKVGEGDDVFFVGMFTEHTGRECNQPIVRFGNIALMPREKIPVKLDKGSDATTLIDAYLVEARSWGGHSGSPTFIYYPPDRQPGTMILGEQSFALLGLVHGHYEIEQDVAFIGDILGSGKVPVNAGVAVVIPAQSIIDTLMQPELLDQRNRLLEEHRHRSTTPADAGVTNVDDQPKPKETVNHD